MVETNSLKRIWWKPTRSAWSILLPYLGLVTAGAINEDFQVGPIEEKQHKNV